jgi:hypothetical protein
MLPPFPPGLYTTISHARIKSHTGQFSSRFNSFLIKYYHKDIKFYTSPKNKGTIPLSCVIGADTIYLVLVIKRAELALTVLFSSPSTNHRHTANEGTVRIQYKCPVSIYVLPEMKLCRLVIPKQNYNVLSPNSYIHMSVRDLKF